MTTQAYRGPVPNPQPEWDQYWEKAKARELWLMRCDDCNKAYFYPRALCPMCFGRNTRWFQSSGKGTLYTFAIVHRAPNPAFAEKVPYVVGIVELEDGVRMATNIVDVEPDPANLKVGMPVEVTFEDLTETITLPKFRPA